MKTKKIFLLIDLILIAFLSYGQHLKKDGTPDMRYKENKQSYVNPSTSISNTNSDVKLQDEYIKSDGTIVEPHYKTKANKTNEDNFSTNGNVNTYTGKAGTKAKDYSPDAQNYGKGKVTQTGSKGGQYYINSKGNKTYVPKRY